MRGIGGNTTALIQVRTTSENAIGEAEMDWTTVQSLFGWLDLSSGDSKYTTYSAKIQESTHVFVADYVPLDSKINAENCRILIGNQVFDVMLIDNPMELQYGSQLEIFLKYTGGQNG